MSVADRKEMDKLESAIATDQAELLVHARRTAHLRVAMFEEMQWLHKNKTFMSLAYAQWTRGMVQSAEKQVESWMDIERVAKALPLLFES